MPQLCLFEARRGRLACVIVDGLLPMGCPLSALGYRTPEEFVAMGGWPTSATLRRASHPLVSIGPTFTALGT
jgi:hypothetical protein